jgi:zinc/manganese transport system substrate-binding protein
MLFIRISRWLTAVCLILAWPNQATAAGAAPIRVVVSFSILGDFVRQIGADAVAVTSLIGPDSDAHVFEPSPDQARLLAQAQLFVINGLGFEGWLTRLIHSAQYHGPVAVATEGITPITTTEAGDAMPSPDPHAWQDPRNAIIYIDNITRALAGSDPAHADTYQQRFQHFKAELEALDRHVRDELDPIPAGKRRVITSHDAFAYYGKAYDVAFLAAEGVSTDSEPSAKTIAELIRQIRRQGIKALFLENITDPRLVEELAREAGVTLGPPLYSDALSRPDEPAPTYIRMIEYNTGALKEGMLKN